MESSRDDFVIAIRSAFLKKENKQRFSLLSLIFFSIIFLALGKFNFKIVEFNKTVIKEIIYISSFIVTIPENFIKKSFNNTSDHFRYYEDYQVTKNEVQKLRNKDLSKQIISFENMELKKLIDDYFVEDSQAYAKVLIDKKSKFLRSIIINKGSKNGVKAGMVVYDDIYLIGKVVEVNFLTSRVLLISDINSKVPVTIQPLDIEAIMTGLDKQKGELQYIKNETLINKDKEEFIVITSGSGGVFKSGIPIGKISSADSAENNTIIVDFYSDFSQLKYVKILSHKKDSTNLDQSNRQVYEDGQNKISKINNQAVEIELLQKQKVILEKIRNKLEEENTDLKEKLITTEIEMERSKKNINEKDKDEKELKFLKLNLLYGHLCRKSFFKPNLFNISTSEYRTCVANKGPVKKIR